MNAENLQKVGGDGAEGEGAESTEGEATSTGETGEATTTGEEMSGSKNKKQQLSKDMKSKSVLIRDDDGEGDNKSGSEQEHSGHSGSEDDVDWSKLPFKENQVVEICNLTNAPQFNGKMGKVVDYDAEKNAFIIEMTGIGEVALEESNMKLV